MMLLWLILIPLLGGAAAWLAGRAREAAARWVALASVTAALALALVLWVRAPVAPLPGDGDRWTLELVWDWMPRLGIGFHLALDGLSLLLIVLTLFIAVLSVVASWTEVSQRVPFFHFNLLWVVAGIIGMFLAMDLFLFFFFWELTLVPVYLLIAIWGHQNRVYAAVKFFIFTQVSGLLMLVAIVRHGLAAPRPVRGPELRVPGPARGRRAGAHRTVADARLLPRLRSEAAGGAVPHLAPDAHTEAPTAGSVILAALLLKTGGYGLIRFAVPLFPEASAAFAPWR
jgi:NADH-quinone oxidoreductase subunit M